MATDTKKVSTTETEAVATTNTDNLGIDTPIADELRHVNVVDLDPNLLEPSPLNFFKELEGAKFEELKDSIRSNGVLMPVIVRPRKDGKFETLAGWNRRRAAIEVGLKTIPARIVEVDDNKANEIVIDTNVVQRQELSPMEIAKAYAEKMKAIGNRQGQRTDLKDDAPKGATRDIVAKELKVSGITVSRYLALNNLIEEFQDAVDEGRIAVKTGMKLGLMDEKSQRAILSAFKNDLNNLTAAKVERVRKHQVEQAKAKAESGDKKTKAAPKPVTVTEVKEIVSPPKVDIPTVTVKMEFTPETVSSDTWDFIDEYEGSLETLLVRLLETYVMEQSEADKNKGKK